MIKRGIGVLVIIILILEGCAISPNDIAEWEKENQTGNLICVMHDYPDVNIQIKAAEALLKIWGKKKKRGNLDDVVENLIYIVQSFPGYSISSNAAKLLLNIGTPAIKPLIDDVHHNIDNNLFDVGSENIIRVLRKMEDKIKNKKMKDLIAYTITLYKRSRDAQVESKLYKIIRN